MEGMVKETPATTSHISLGLYRHLSALVVFDAVLLKSMSEEKEKVDEILEFRGKSRV